MTGIERLFARQDWMDRAACRGRTDVTFFSLKADGSDTRGESRAAKLVCRECPVRQQCFDYGLDERHGMWGGTSPEERKELRKRRRQGQPVSMPYIEAPTPTGGVREDCGTMAGVAKHRRKHERVCDLCREADARRNRERREASRIAPPSPTQHRAVCGTQAGGTLHRRHGEALCEPCEDADARRRGRAG